MKLDQGPSFRKAVTPWHDSNFFCIIITLCMALVFFFGNVGFRYALDHEEYWAYRWVPLVLMVASAIILTTNLTRLILRFLRRPSDDDD